MYPCKLVRARSERGFSLPEVVVAVAIAVVLLTAVAQLFRSQVDAFDQQKELLKVQQNARSAADVILSELRSAGYDPLGTAGAGIVLATATTVRFTHDLNADGDVLDPGEDIRYILIDTDSDGVLELGRSTDGGSTYQSVVEGITQLEFEYTLSDGTVTTTPGSPAEIRTVKVKLSSQLPGGEVTKSSTFSISLRNLLIAGS